MSVAEPPNTTLAVVKIDDYIQVGAPGHERRGTVASTSDLRYLVNWDDGGQSSIDNCAYGLKVLRSAVAITPAEPAEEEITPLETLTEEEAEELARCEAAISAGLAEIKGGLFKVGVALDPIQDGKLYKATHPTFESYCRDQWNLGKAYAYQLIQAAKTRELLSATAAILPETERQTRPLNPLPDEQKATAWERAVEIAGGEQPTNKEVAQAVDEIKHDYRGWEVGHEIWWIDGAENVRHGVIEQLWQGRLMTRATDGGQENQLIAVDPTTARERDAKAPAATPFGVCEEPPLHNAPAVAPDQHSYGLKLCERCLAQRQARDRVDQMSAAAGMPELAGDLKTAAGLAPDPDPVEDVPEAALGAADQAVAAPPVPTAAEIAAKRAEERTNKPGVLKSAEDKVKERAAAAAEPRKPQPVNFPIMPDLAERIKASGIGTLPAIRFGLALAERAQQHGTEAHLLLKEFFDAHDLCLADAYSLREVVEAGIRALDTAAMAPVIEAAAVEEVRSVFPDLESEAVNG